MTVEYEMRTTRTGTKGKYQCDRDEIKSIIRHWTDADMWLRVYLPNGAVWYYARTTGWKLIRAEGK